MAPSSSSGVELEELDALEELDLLECVDKYESCDFMLDCPLEVDALEAATEHRRTAALTLLDGFWMGLRVGEVDIIGSVGTVLP